MPGSAPDLRDPQNVSPTAATPLHQEVIPPQKKRFKCFNCGREGCTVATCKEPRDQARIDRNRKAFMDAKNKKTSNAKRSNDSSSPNRGKKYSALADGAPLIKNKKGEFAPDLHAQAIAKKAIAAHKKNSAQAQLNSKVEPPVEKPSAAKTSEAMTAEIKPKESAGDFYSRILKE